MILINMGAYHKHCEKQFTGPIYDLYIWVGFPRTDLYFALNYFVCVWECIKVYQKI